MQEMHTSVVSIIDIAKEILHYYLKNQTIGVTLRKFYKYNLLEKGIN